MCVCMCVCVFVVSHRGTLNLTWQPSGCLSSQPSVCACVGGTPVCVCVCVWSAKRF